MSEDDTLHFEWSISLDPTTFGSEWVELHDKVVAFQNVEGEVRAMLADGSYYVVGVSDQHKLVVHLGRDLLNS